MKKIFSHIIFGVVLAIATPLFSEEHDAREKVMLDVNYIVCGSYQQKDDLMRYCKDLQDKATLKTKQGPFRASLDYHIILVTPEELDIKEQAKKIIGDYESLTANHRDVDKMTVINTLMEKYSISESGFLRCLYIEKLGESFAADLRLGEEIKHWDDDAFILFGYLGTKVLDLIRISKIIPSLIILHNVPITSDEEKYLIDLKNTKIINVFTSEGKDIPFIGPINKKDFPKTANIELEINDDILRVSPDNKMYDIVQSLEANAIVDLCDAVYKFEQAKTR